MYLSEDDQQLVAMVADFVDNAVRPNVRRFEEADATPSR